MSLFYNELLKQNDFWKSEDLTFQTFWMAFIIWFRMEKRRGDYYEDEVQAVCLFYMELSMVLTIMNEQPVGL